MSGRLRPIERQNEERECWGLTGRTQSGSFRRVLVPGAIGPTLPLPVLSRAYSGFRLPFIRTAAILSFSCMPGILCARNTAGECVPVGAGGVWAEPGVSPALPLVLVSSQSASHRRRSKAFPLPLHASPPYPHLSSLIPPAFVCLPLCHISPIFPVTFMNSVLFVSLCFVSHSGPHTRTLFYLRLVKALPVPPFIGQRSADCLASVIWCPPSPRRGAAIPVPSSMCI